MRHHVVLVFVPHDPPPPRVEALPSPWSPPPGARVAPHLAQWHALAPGRVEAHYAFDDAYARAHPEALDRAHLAMLHALITCKLFDEGDVIIPPAQVAGSILWPPVERPPRPLGGG